MSNLTGLVLVMSLVGAQEDGSDLLHQYADDVIGRWAGEGVLTTDLEGVGAKGDKITGHAITSWLLDKSVIECNWNFGGAAGKWIVFYDSTTKQLRRYSVSTTGAFSHDVIARDGEKWLHRPEHAGRDGKVVKGIAIGYTRDEGKVFVWEEKEQSLGDERLPNFTHTWTRIGE